MQDYRKGDKVLCSTAGASELQGVVVERTVELDWYIVRLVACGSEMFYNTRSLKRVEICI